MISLKASHLPNFTLQLNNNMLHGENPVYNIDILRAHNHIISKFKTL